MRGTHRRLDPFLHAVIVPLLALGVLPAAAQELDVPTTTGTPPRLQSGPVPLQPPEWPVVAIDLHGATIGVPSQAGFYPPLNEDVAIPSRGFGATMGAHTYPARLGIARLGVGATVTVARATVGGSAAGGATSLLARIVAPQVSFNFGTPLGWSYISGGMGVASLRGRAAAGDTSTTQGSGALLAINVGGGARWFITSHVAFSFDLRVHRVAGGRDGRTSGATLGGASVGVSLR